MNVLGATAANAIDEVRVVVTGSFAVWAGFELIGEPGFVGVVAVDGEKAFRAIEEVADSVGLGIFWTQGLLRDTRFFVSAGGESRGGNGAGSVSARTDLRFVIGDPVAD